MQDTRVYVTRRRGKLHLCWREGKRVRYKSCRTDDPTEAEIQRRKLEAELGQNDPDLFKLYREQPLAKQLDEYSEHMRADGTSDKHVHMVRQRVLRVLDATGIEFIGQLSASRIKRAVAKFKRLPASPKTPPETGHLTNHCSQHWRKRRPPG